MRIKKVHKYEYEVATVNYRNNIFNFIPNRRRRNALITGENKGNEGHWPWHAAIYYVEKPQKAATTEQKNYICGGSLIDAKSILTAAHCVYKNRQLIEPENVIVLMGKLNLNVTESTCQPFNVILIFLVLFSLDSKF